MGNTTTAAGMLSAITAALDLDSRTIIFHVIDGTIASGSILDRDDVENSDVFLDLASECDSVPTLTVGNVTTYMLGTGEADAATGADIDTLDRFHSAAPAVFDAMLDEHADILASLDDITVSNPYYIDD